MVYLTTSVKPVIGRVLRTARLTDMTYADDIIEWIGEGLNRMLIRWRLNRTHAYLTIEDHQAKLPCGLVSLNGVIYNGQRLRKGASEIDVRIQPWKKADTIDSFFVHDTTIQAEDINSQNYTLTRGLDIQQITTQTIEEFYQLRYNYIKTSFKSGVICILYKKADTDDEGYPLVPDLEEARAALFWYVCAQLCFTGYKLPDSSMDFKFCDDKATEFFRKAKNIIKTQSIDEKEETVQLLNNLIPPYNYYRNFFVGGEQQKYVNK